MKSSSAFACGLVSALVFAACGATPESAPSAPPAGQGHAPQVSVEGSVVRPGLLTPALTAGLPSYRSLVKVAAPDGSYRCTLEVEGYALEDVMNRFEVKKRVDDGFDRPLDVFFTARGRDGRTAVASYSEAFLAGDSGPLLAERVRLVLPHHHEPIAEGPNDVTSFMDAAARVRADVSSCSSCHDGKTLAGIARPKGWMFVVPQDGFGGRAIDDLASISVDQIGVDVKASKGAGETAIVETPELVGADGARVPLTAAALKAAPRRAWKDATFGMGRGFHGMRAWEGAELGALLRPMLPAGADPRLTWVLVTAEDGYRAVYSGSEVFAAPEGREVVVADLIDGAAPGAGSGRYHVVSRADFYVDRDVKMVKEIRLGVVQ